MLPAAAVLACLGAGTASAMTAGSLVVNGDAEAPPGAEWVASTGALLRQPYGQAGFPEALLVGGGTFDGGTAMFHGSGATTVATQELPLSADDRAVIATGTVRATLSAHLGGYQDQTDRMTVLARWRDASSAVVLTQTLTPPSPAERGNASAFVARADEQPVPATATSVSVTLDGVRDQGSSQDGYVDDVALRLKGIPGLTVAVAGGPDRSVPAGTPVAVTWTVTNSEDLETKPAWRFETALPKGLTISSGAAARTTCADADVRSAGTGLAVDGALPTDATSCTVTADVVAATPGRYALDPSDVVDAEGLRPPTSAVPLVVGPAVDDPGQDPTGTPSPAVGSAPAPSPTVLPGAPLPSAPLPDPPLVPASSPVAVPAPTPGLPVADRLLRVGLVGAPTTVRVGRTVVLRARVENRTAAALTDVDVCLRLPAALLYLPRPHSGTLLDGRRCWSVDRIAGHASRTVALTVRARRTGTTSTRASAAAAQAVGTTTSDRTIRVTR